MVEPSDAQECKDFVKLACEISEEFDTPVLYRTTTRVCHSKGLVEFGERTEHVAPEYKRNTRKYICAPANAYANHPLVEERLAVSYTHLRCGCRWHDHHQDRHHRKDPLKSKKEPCSARNRALFYTSEK